MFVFVGFGGFLRKTIIFPGILLTSLKLSATLPVLSITTKKNPDQCGGKNHRKRPQGKGTKEN